MKLRCCVALIVTLSACEKVKPPPDPLLQGATKMATWKDLEKNVGKKVYLSGRTTNVDGRAAIEFDGGAVFVGKTTEWDAKMGKQYITGVGTLQKEDPVEPGGKPTYMLLDFQSRGFGLR